MNFIFRICTRISRQCANSEPVVLLICYGCGMVVCSCFRIDKGALECVHFSARTVAPILWSREPDLILRERNASTTQTNYLRTMVRRVQRKARPRRGGASLTCRRCWSVPPLSGHVRRRFPTFSVNSPIHASLRSKFSKTLQTFHCSFVPRKTEVK